MPALSDASPRGHTQQEQDMKKELSLGSLAFLFAAPALVNLSTAASADRADDESKPSNFTISTTEEEQRMTEWSKHELGKIAETDDLHISPFREDSVTYGTRRGFGRSW
jgi:hypothetical protein